MRAFIAIYLKEMRAYLSSPIAYALMVAYLAVTGYFFYTAAAQYAFISLQAMQNPMLANMKLHQFLVGPLLGNQSIILLLVVPLLTMRLLSEEKRTGTIELLLSYPLGDTCVVLAKFAAAWSMVALMLFFSAGQMVLLSTLAQVHWSGILVGYLGLLLLGGGFVAFGIMISAATENQIISAVGSFAGLLILWIINWSGETMGNQAGSLFKSLSLGEHFMRFPQGLLDTADLAYFVLFIFFFLFVGIRNLEAKRWKA